MRQRLGWLVIALLGGCWQGARAHDVPNARIDRSTQVILTPGRLQVTYEVALAELTLVQDLRQLDGDSFTGDRGALFERYARVVGPLNARGLLVTVDGVEVDLQAMDFTIHVEDHLRIAFQFAADVPTAGRLRLADTNYASSEGSARLGLRVDPGLVVEGDQPPADVGSIPWRGVWEMTDQDERRSKRLDVAYRPRTSGAGAAGTVPRSLSAPARPATKSPPSAEGLTRLLDRPVGVGAVGWWLTAFLLGAVHAIQPGHGKTLVAAATLAGKPSAARGVALGLITAGCHLASVAAVAALLWWVQGQGVTAIHLAIARTSGVVIAAVGAFRAGRCLAGLTPEHDHGLKSPRNASVWTLGLAGGSVPCWDAVALVVLASSLGQLGWGLTLLVAFSLGLAVVLVGVGLIAARLRRGRLAQRFERGGGQRWLGLGSAVVLVVIGCRLLGG